MDFKVQRNDFMKALAFVAGVLVSKNSLPVLSNVLLRVDGDTLSITSTDLEIEMISSIPVSNEESSASLVTVPGKKLVDIVRCLREDSVLRFRQMDNKVVVTSGKSRFTLSTLPAETFPDFESRSFDVSFSAPGSEIKKLIQNTSFAIAKKDVRYYLNGLNIVLSTGRLTFVATDGHRLAHSSIALESLNSIEQEVSIILPAKAVSEIGRLMDDVGDDVSFSVSSNGLRAELSDFTLTARLVDAKYPDYKKVVPEKNKKSNIIQIDRLEFLGCLRRAAILANSKYRGVKATIFPTEITISSQNESDENSEECIGLTGKAPEEIAVGFCCDYMLDVLNVMKCEKVSLFVRDGGSSILIDDGVNDQSFHVVMPMRL